MNPPDISPSILGQRLQQARKSAGLTQQQAADRLSVARTTIVSIEKGDRSARPDELVALAELYVCSVSDLVRQQEPLRNISLQLRGELAPELRAKLEVRCQRLAEDYLHVEQLRNAKMPHLLPPEVAPGDDPKRAARLAAEDERRRLGLGDAPILSMRDLFEERLGVRVFLLDELEDRRVSGIYFYEASAGPVVCANAAHHWHRRRSSFGHEYGHVMGSRYKTEVMVDNDEPASARRVPEEVFADSFGSYFLMPPAALERLVRARKRERNGKFLVSDIDELAAAFGVSFEAMCRALEEEGLVRPHTSALVRSQGYRPVISLSASGRFEQDAETRSMSHRCERLATAAFLDHQISEGAFARLLRVDRLDARDIVRRFLSSDEGAPSSRDVVALQDIS